MSRLIAGCVPACFFLSSPFAAATDGPPSDKADADAVLEPIVVTGSYAAPWTSRPPPASETHDVATSDFALPLTR